MRQTVTYKTIYAFGPGRDAEVLSCTMMEVYDVCLGTWAMRVEYMLL